MFDKSFLSISQLCAAGGRSGVRQGRVHRAGEGGVAETGGEVQQGRQRRPAARETISPGRQMVQQGR